MIATFEPGHSLRLKADMPEPRRLPNGVYVAGFGGGWSNYAHWMQQTLPRLAAFLQLKLRHPDLRLILPAFPPGSFQAQTLQLLGITRGDIANIDHHAAVSVHDVWLIDRPDIWTVALFFRVGAALLNSGIATESGFGPDIYIRRGTGIRTVANFSDLAPVLACHGFAVVDFDVMPLDQQIATMRGARRIVGEHGAGLINIMFCREGAGVIELFNPACVQPAFWSVASVCGLRYGFLVGVHPHGASDTPSWNSDYVIDPARLESALQALV
jgi:capsular polysaccharide biosynthesis protein